MESFLLTLNFDLTWSGCRAAQAELSLGLESPGWRWHFLQKKEASARVDQKQASCCLGAGRSFIRWGLGWQGKEAIHVADFSGSRASSMYVQARRAMVEHSVGLRLGAGDKAGVPPVSQGQSGSG